MQRVLEAEVSVDGEVVGRAGPGLLILVCALQGDTDVQAERLARKIAGFRCFHDERGRMGRSLVEVEGEALVVSQFTLAADGRKGRRPSFDRALAPSEAEPLVERFVELLAQEGVPVQTGRFGAAMKVSLVNDGPVTFVLEEGS